MILIITGKIITIIPPKKPKNFFEMSINFLWSSIDTILKIMIETRSDKNKFFQLNNTTTKRQTPNKQDVISKWENCNGFGFLATKIKLNFSYNDKRC